VERSHGTERAMSELLLRLARDYNCEIHLYSQRVEDLSVRSTDEAGKPGEIVWHRVPSSRGPHLLQFLHWYLRNRALRSRDRKKGLHFDGVFSPGINCSDAGLILVHAVFHRLAELDRSSPKPGLRGLHQRLYYRLLCRFERRIYSNRAVTLAAVSRHTAGHLSHYFGREDVTVIPNGVDPACFSPSRVAALRASERQGRQFGANERVLLLIGNDWHNKGLGALLEAASLCRDLPLRLLVVGQEDPSPFRAVARRLHVEERVSFAPPDDHVLRFYAAADILVAPSFEDSFNLPALEAMSCGLPVIVSGNAGISEWIVHGTNGLVLQDARDSRELAEAIRNLLRDPEWMRRMGENAAQTAATLSWDQHAAAVHKLLSSIASAHRV
jgi:glycosyltransferase involved in cell wall biosynthesis